MGMALAVNLALVVAAGVGAVVFHSVALVGDAGHVLSDVGAIGLAMFAAAIAARPARGRRTFGFHRTEILAALANGVTLVAVAVFVFVESVMRLSQPSDVRGLGVLDGDDAVPPAPDDQRGHLRGEVEAVNEIARVLEFDGEEEGGADVDALHFTALQVGAARLDLVSPEL